MPQPCQPNHQLAQYAHNELDKHNDGDEERYQRLRTAISPSDRTSSTSVARLDTRLKGSPTKGSGTDRAGRGSQRGRRWVSGCKSCLTEYLSSLVKASSERQMLSYRANHVRRFSMVPKPPRKRASYPVQTTRIRSLSGVESTFTRRSPIASSLRSEKSTWKPQGNTIPS
jgi:hypothetical protein